MLAEKTPITWTALLLAVLPLKTGCQNLQTVPAVCYPSAAEYAPRSSQEPIDFTHLRQTPPAVYMLGAGDVLGIYIEGILGQSNEAPPVHFAESGDIPPAIGYPLPVREDGSLSLPLVPPLRVEGLTLAQAEDEIRKAYTVTHKILQPDQARIIVTLMRPRTYQVLVIREDATMPSFRQGASKGELVLGSGKRGITYAVELPAYENDVLHALAESGGLPGIDAKNEVTVLRGPPQAKAAPDIYLASLVQEIDDDLPFTPEVLQTVPQAPREAIKIPLRRAPGEPMPDIREDDILLNPGDIVFIESREAEVFYTGGLLKGGQFPIPRDYDLDVLGAMAMAGGSVAEAAGGAAGIGGIGGSSSGGVGSIFPPTRVTVLRTVNGQQTAIRVNVKRAVLDPRERILIEPNDFILLEYKPHELVLNILLNNLQFNYFLNNLN